MLDSAQRGHPTSNVLAWSSHGANVEPSVEEDAGADADEPPDQHQHIPVSPITSRFQKNTVRRAPNAQESLLTKALQSHSEDETADGVVTLITSRRRRSLTSNVSFASTAELTSDTGITTPARTSSPGPHIPEVACVACTEAVDSTAAARHKKELTLADGLTTQTPTQSKDVATVPAPEKKRCISFACVAKPARKDSTALPPPLQPDNATAKATVSNTTIRPCIKFACPARPAAETQPRKQEVAPTPKPIVKVSAATEGNGPTTAVRKLRSSSVLSQSRNGRSITPRRSAQSPVATRPKKFLTAESQDLQCEPFRFHAFASDEPQEDDWIRQDKTTATRRRLTIDDTLKMELAIRRLGKEAEEEAEQEEDEEDTAESPNGDDGDEVEGEDDDDEELEDDNSGYGSDNDASDGYNTDTEVGFASSDDEDDDLVLWTTRQPGHASLSGATPVIRRPSLGEHSDSSAYSERNTRSRRSKNRDQGIRYRPGTPELPDSTDFVCGTLDEDKPLEEAYKSCIAARKLEKLHLIPQDIDPSFPASGPEDEESEELFKAAQHDSDEHGWLHGELEDLHHEQDRSDRRKKKGDSPKRYHSPPPKRHHSPPLKRHHSPPPPKRHHSPPLKRHHSPPPKARGRSPRRLFDHHSSPKRLGSPPPQQMITSPPASPVHAEGGIAFKSLAFRPGLTHTKSLPKAPALFPHMKPHRRGRANTITKDKHVRGAIDIVKGLEQKRQRRKEKFQQKYCNRARKGLVHEKKPQPGHGAERMKELGLLMAGKIGQGKYVISF